MEWRRALGSWTAPSRALQAVVLVLYAGLIFLAPTPAGLVLVGSTVLVTGYWVFQASRRPRLAMAQWARREGPGGVLAFGFRVVGWILFVAAILPILLVIVLIGMVLPNYRRRRRHPGDSPPGDRGLGVPAGVGPGPRTLRGADAKEPAA